MELPTFTFDSSDVVVPDDVDLGTALARELIKDIYDAWVGSLNAAAPIPTTRRLRASLKRIEQGSSGVEVLELSFIREPDNDALVTFVARVHPISLSSSPAAVERRLADTLSLAGHDEICCRTLPGQFLENRAIVYYHAGREFRRLDEVLAKLCESADESTFLLFLNRLNSFLQTVTSVYDNFTHAAMQLPVAQYISNIASEIQPDLVLDLRNSNPQVSTGSISLPGIDASRTKSISPRQLVEAVSNRRQKPLSVHIDFAIQHLVQSRYLSLPLISLKGEGEIEMWVLIEPQLLETYALESTIRLHIFLPCSDIRLATEVLADHGFATSSIHQRTRYLQILREHGSPELRAALRHRDLHSGNVLAQPTQLKLIDLGDVNIDLVGVDVSRLEVSLIRRLIDRVGLTLADIHAVIDALEEVRVEHLERRLQRIVKVLETLRDAARHIRDKHSISDEQIILSRLLQVLFHQRYILAEVLAGNVTSRTESFAGYSAAVSNDYEDLSRRPDTTTAHGESVGLLTPEGGLGFGDLWTRALSSNPGFILPEAEAVMRAVRSSVGDAWNSPLTDLQISLLATDVDPSDEPFTSMKHVLLYGPTSCGKTTLADTFLVRTALLNVHRRLGLFIAPTRALAQEKYYELRSKLANTVLAEGLVLSTGENLQQDHRILTARFSIAVMVYEKANVLFSRNRRALDQLGCVVVDEIHMVEDLERGPMLEMALTKIQENRRRLDRRTNQSNEHLRLIAISTEGADPGSLAAFLSVTDPDTLSPVPPLIFRGHKRPVPVKHQLVVPTAGRRFDNVIVTTIAQDTDRILSSDRLLEIARSLQPTHAILAAARHETGKADLQTRLFNLLDSRINQLRSNGYRAVVFVPSKTDLEMMAEAYRIGRRAQQDVLPSFTLDRLRAAAKSAGEMDTGHRVVLAAAKGVFIHHSEVEPGARRIIEELLSEPLRPGISQVVFATETLSYGVNLSVTDVILFGTKFFTSGRRRSVSPSRLSVCAFHNMMGRAGRLGRGGATDASAFVLVAQEANPFNEIVKVFYSDVPALSSSLVDREDKAILLAEIERQENELGGGVSFAQEFSYPFVRSVLDALRHLSVVSSPSRTLYAKVRATDLQSFLFRTLYAEQRLRPAGGEGVARERELFKTAIDCTLRDLAKSPLNLVERESREGDDFYSITSRGEAIIDTGTEITTLTPLLYTTRKLQDKWHEASGGKRFPSALYLLAVVSQVEAYRHVIRCAPEVSDAEMVRLPPDDAKSNRDRVLEQFSTALEAMNVSLPDSLTPMALRGVLDECLTPSRNNEFYGKYEGGLTDAVLRLFAAVAAWSRGNPRSRVRELILGTQGDPIRSTQLSGFGGFRDQSSWKLIFLAKILSSPDALAVKAFDTKDEKELFSLALSVRIGCELQACRLIFQDYQESLSREEATALFVSGYSGDRLVQEPTLSPPQSIPVDRFAALRSRLCAECADRYISLSGTWTAALGPEPSEAELAALWDATAKAFRAAIDCYYGTKVGSARVEATMAAQSRWPSIIEGERRQVREAGLADRTVLRFAAGTDEVTVRWVLESIVDDESAPEVRLVVRGIQVLSDWSALTERGGSSIDELLPSPDDEKLVVCVTFPWIPPSSVTPPALKDSLAIRAGRGQRVVFISPAAFMLLLSCAIRAFLPLKNLIGVLFSGAVRRADGLNLVGFDQAEEVLLTQGGSSMPGALRESLLNHYELGFR